MSVNYIPQIAQMLGVEIGEEFNVKFWETGCVFPARFEEECLMLKSADGKWSKNIPWLQFVLDGSAGIVKKPWKPKFGDAYYTWRKAEPYETITVEQFGFIDRDYDIFCYRLGNCYRTKEEAEADREKWERFYGSDERIEWE